MEGEKRAFSDLETVYLDVLEKKSNKETIEDEAIVLDVSEHALVARAKREGGTVTKDLVTDYYYNIFGEDTKLAIGDWPRIRHIRRKGKDIFEFTMKGVRVASSSGSSVSTEANFVLTSLEEAQEKMKSYLAETFHISEKNLRGLKATNIIKKHRTAVKVGNVSISIDRWESEVIRGMHAFEGWWEYTRRFKGRLPTVAEFEVLYPASGADALMQERVAERDSLLKKWNLTASGVNGGFSDIMKHYGFPTSNEIHYAMQRRNFTKRSKYAEAHGDKVTIL